MTITAVTDPRSDTGDVIMLDALGYLGDYRTRNRAVIEDSAGVAVAELSIVPPLYVSRAISAQRKTRPLSVTERAAALAEAAEIFSNSTIAGLDFDAYVALASRVSGLPIAV